MKPALIIILFAMSLTACTSPLSKQLFPDANVVAAGHSIRWVAPAESEGLAYIVEAKSGKIILSQSITKTNRTIFFGSQDPEIRALIGSALCNSSVADPEFRLYYREIKK